jgi:hypothetical protein
VDTGFPARARAKSLTKAARTTPSQGKKSAAGKHGK